MLARIAANEAANVKEMQGKKKKVIMFDTYMASRATLNL
jgi:hypothetical protein